MTPERITREDVLRVLPLPAAEIARMLERAQKVVTRLSEYSDRAQERLADATLAYVDRTPGSYDAYVRAQIAHNVAIAKWQGADMVLEAIRYAAADV